MSGTTLCFLGLEIGVGKTDSARADRRRLQKTQAMDRVACAVSRDCRHRSPRGEGEKSRGDGDPEHDPARQHSRPAQAITVFKCADKRRASLTTVMVGLSKP